MAPPDSASGKSAETRTIFSTRVSPAFRVGVIGGLLLVLSLYTAYRIGTINARHQTESRDLTTRIQVPLFVDPKEVRYTTRFNFMFDAAESLRSFREDERLETIVPEGAGVWESAVALLHWTSSQWEPGRPDPYPPVNAGLILGEIRAGRTGGFCAQYNYVFVQALQSFGITARYVTVVDHEVTEVWMPELRKWVCFDPYHDAYYTDNYNVPLSVHEIYDRLRRGLNVEIVGEHRTRDVAQHLRKFRRFAMWIRNDHVDRPINFVDIERHKVYYVTSAEEAALVPGEAMHTNSLSNLYFDPLE